MRSFRVKQRHHGADTEKYLKDSKTAFNKDSCDKIADDSLSDFKKVSPTKEIENGWHTEVIEDKNSKRTKISYQNEKKSVVVSIDVGHATSSGKWIPGKNYLKEAIRKLYEKIDRKLRGGK